MSLRVGINGFGRIGRSFTRALLARGLMDDVTLAAINDPFGDSEIMAFLLKHDSVSGMLEHRITATGSGLDVDGFSITKFEEKDPAAIDWKAAGVDVVIESTGLFTSREAAAAHLAGGAKKVIISAPSPDADATICMGVNDEVYSRKDHDVISNASCTTNCLAPLAKVLDESLGIQSGFMTTVHAYTSDQQLQDMAAPSRKGKADVRRMRAANLSIIPSSTGAAKAIGMVLPQLAGKLDGFALRVPTPVGSITDLTVQVDKSASVEEVNALFEKASNDKSYRGVLEYTAEELVSSDIVGNPSSCIYSSPDTMATGNSVKVLGWYDNEWGYSNRLVDLAMFLEECGL
ncbi:MAG TPA: type I glyceraldehyde-3-phosphate dehydrogenase [Acidimicrobiia bacterium]|nr:type I glyceraldehyde-3-phosphate dehydrogenase [Acidimicrobiia bacterium]